ncbi:hypothetical protein JRQ81_001673, partial [Phrynocephalus forsythii]
MPRSEAEGREEMHHVTHTALSLVVLLLGPGLEDERDGERLRSRRESLPVDSLRYVNDFLWRGYSFQSTPASSTVGEANNFYCTQMVKLICTLRDHKDDVNCCAFSSSYLATCSLDKTVRLYSLSNFNELPYSPLRGHTYAVHCCCFSSLGHILASCSTDGTTILWNTENGLKLAVLEHPCRSPIRICRFSPDSTYMVSGAADGSVNLWNVQSLKVCQSGSVKDGSLVACAFAPNGSFFVTGSSCGDLTVWDDKMRCLYNEKVHDLGVTCCDFSLQPLS